MLRLFLITILVWFSTTTFASAQVVYSKKNPMPFEQVLLQGVAKGVDLCSKLKQDCAFGIVNQEGDPLLSLRMHGSLPLDVQLAVSKAFTSAMFDINTAEYEAFSRKGKPLYGISYLNNNSFPQFTGIAGGEPMTLPNGRVIGIGTASVAVNGHFQDYQNARTAVKISSAVIKAIKHVIKTQKPIYDLQSLGMHDQTQRIISDQYVMLDGFSHVMNLCRQQGKRCGLAVVSPQGLVEGAITQPGAMPLSYAWAVSKAKTVAIQGSELLQPTLSATDGVVLNADEQKHTGVAAAVVDAGIQPVNLARDYDKKFAQAYVDYAKKHYVVARQACLRISVFGKKKN